MMIACDLTLARRLEDLDTHSNVVYAQTKANIFPASGSIAVAAGDGYIVYTGPQSPINRVHGLGMHKPVAAATLDAAEEFYRQRNLATTVDLCPLADGSLLAELRARRYAVLLFKHVWVRSLERLEELPAANPAIHVAVVRPEERLLWAEVVASSFGGGKTERSALEIPLPTSFKPDTTCFLARIGDEPAGGGALAMHAGAGVCFSTSVRPMLRRMGVQTALLHARLVYARDHGCELMMVQTTPGSASQRNVERFGFRIAYTKATMTWEPVTDPR